MSPSHFRSSPILSHWVSTNILYYLRPCQCSDVSYNRCYPQTVILATAPYSYGKCYCYRFIGNVVVVEPFKRRMAKFVPCSSKRHILLLLKLDKHHLPAYSCSKRGIGPGGDGVQYTWLVRRRLPPLDGYVAVCLIFTIDVYLWGQCLLASHFHWLRSNPNGSVISDFEEQKK